MPAFFVLAMNVVRAHVFADATKSSSGLTKPSGPRNSGGVANSKLALSPKDVVA